MEQLSKIMLFSGYIDSEGNKICNGDSVTYIGYDYYGNVRKGTVKYGEYEDGEQYMNAVHCGWYIVDDDPNVFTTTLPDAVKSGNIHIIGGKMIARN